MTYVSFPAIVATSIVAVLQAPDGKDSDILFKCTVSLISHILANSKHMIVLLITGLKWTGLKWTGLDWTGLTKTSEIS